MQLQIDLDALDLIFRMLLTCGCPITEDEERDISNLIKAPQSEESITYRTVLAIFQPNVDTVFHRLGDFSTWQAPAERESYTINREHVIRHFSSTYHSLCVRILETVPCQ